jgi:hypothetical protein
VRSQIGARYFTPTTTQDGAGGKKRHREVCYSNAQSPNLPIATMKEPRCKQCERKLEAELR